METLEPIVREIYESLKNDTRGNVADYIPQLGKVNPELFGISVCLVDGTTLNIGDCNEEFCLQSCSKPLSYCVARQVNSLEKVHSHVGYEPSGRAFNAFTLNRQSLPHNPMINAGAMMVCSLIEPSLEPSDRFETVKRFYKKMAGHQGHIGFDNSVFLSEQHHADRNMSLAYYMKENNAFDESVGPSEIFKHLNLYFQCCSITINSSIGAMMAATLANGGVCPMTKETVFEKTVVKDCLSLMYMCGMYDYSGQFAFEIGMPAKSGVSGCLFVVIPNRMGICIWSPRLDEMGNTVRGVEFCRKFNKATNYKYHVFYSIVNDAMDLNNPTVMRETLINACAAGDLDTVKLITSNLDAKKINVGDYDGRTPLHLASAEGHADVVDHLVTFNIDKHPKDRWGNVPLHEAQLALENAKDAEQKARYNRIIECLTK